MRRCVSSSQGARSSSKSFASGSAQSTLAQRQSVSLRILPYLLKEPNQIVPSGSGIQLTLWQRRISPVACGHAGQPPNALCKVRLHGGQEKGIDDDPIHLAEAGSTPIADIGALHWSSAMGAYTQAAPECMACRIDQNINFFFPDPICGTTVRQFGQGYKAVSKVCRCSEREQNLLWVGKSDRWKRLRSSCSRNGCKNSATAWVPKSAETMPTRNRRPTREWPGKAPENAAARSRAVTRSASVSIALLPPFSRSAFCFRRDMASVGVKVEQITVRWAEV